MRAKGPIIFLIIAVALAGAAAWGAQRWMKIQAVRMAKSTKSVAVVVIAADSMEAGRRLEASSLKLMHIPAQKMPKDSFPKAGLLTGRVLRSPVAKGEVIVESKLAPRGSGGGLAAVVGPGYRAMTVKVDDVIGVGGFVKPGDRVDVVVTYAKGPFRNDPVSRTVLQDVTVLTVGAEVQKGVKSRRAKVRRTNVVALKLTPKQAELLALASLEGKLLLSLRNQNDRDEKPTSGVRLTMLLAPPAHFEPVKDDPCLAEAPKPEPPKQAAPPVKTVRVVEIIKGAKRSKHNL